MHRDARGGRSGRECHHPGVSQISATASRRCSSRAGAPSQRPSSAAAVQGGSARRGSDGQTETDSVPPARAPTWPRSKRASACSARPSARRRTSAPSSAGRTRCARSARWRRRSRPRTRTRSHRTARRRTPHAAWRTTHGRRRGGRKAKQKERRRAEAAAADDGDAGGDDDVVTIPEAFIKAAAARGGGGGARAARRQLKTSAGGHDLASGSGATARRTMRASPLA